MTLNEYLRQEAKFECLKIGMSMEKQQQTYQEVLVDILKDRKATEKVVNKFIRDNNRVKIPFQEILNAVKSREGRIWADKKKSIFIENKLASQSLEEREEPPASSPLLKNSSAKASEVGKSSAGLSANPSSAKRKGNLKFEGITEEQRQKNVSGWQI